MALLTAEVGRLQTRWASALDATGTISRPHPTKTAGSGSTVVWVAVATVPCRVRRSRRQPGEQPVAGRVLATQVWDVCLPSASPPDVRPADRILVGARTFEVVDPVADSLGVEFYAVCLELR